MTPLVQYAIDNKSSLFGYLKTFVSNPDDREDIYQDGVENLLRSGPKVVDHERIEGYVKVVLRRCAAEKYNQPSLEQQEEEIESVSEETDLTFEQLFESRIKECRDPLSGLIEAESLDRVGDLIEKHSTPATKGVLRMLFEEFVSYKEVARLTGVKEPAVRKMAQRFREKVAE